MTKRVAKDAVEIFDKNLIDTACDIADQIQPEMLPTSYSDNRLFRHPSYDNLYCLQISVGEICETQIIMIAVLTGEVEYRGFVCPSGPAGVPPWPPNEKIEKAIAAFNQNRKANRSQDEDPKPKKKKSKKEKS